MRACVVVVVVVVVVVAVLIAFAAAGATTPAGRRSRGPRRVQHKATAAAVVRVVDVVVASEHRVGSEEEVFSQPQKFVKLRPHPMLCALARPNLVPRRCYATPVALAGADRSAAIRKGGLLCGERKNWSLQGNAVQKEVERGGGGGRRTMEEEAEAEEEEDNEMRQGQ